MARNRPPTQHSTGSKAGTAQHEEAKQQQHSTARGAKQQQHDTARGAKQRQHSTARGAKQQQHSTAQHSTAQTAHHIWTSCIRPDTRKQAAMPSRRRCLRCCAAAGAVAVAAERRAERRRPGGSECTNWPALGQGGDSTGAVWAKGTPRAHNCARNSAHTAHRIALCCGPINQAAPNKTASACARQAGGRQSSQHTFHNGRINAVAQLVAGHQVPAMSPEV